MRISNFSVLVVVALVPLFLVALYLLYDGTLIPTPVSKTGKEVVKIERVSIIVEIAQTLEEKRRGLGGRDSLQRGEGLLFVFEESDQHSIWMRDMRFPLDIIWIGENLQVVDIAQNVQPGSFPSSFYPDRDALYILEVNAFFVEERGIQIGDSVQIPEIYIKNGLE